MPVGFLRRTARGEDDATPARALGGVATVVYTAVALVVAAAVVVYFLV